MISRPLLILALCTATINTSFGQNISQQEAKEFFDRYVRLSEAYDPSVTDLYLDTSRIASLRRYPHGVGDRTIEIPGHQWKTIVRSAMPVAQAKGDRSEFKNVRIEPHGSQMRVRADRYPVLKCYWDRGYFMLIARQPDGTLKIAEEYLETQPQSAC